MFAKLVTLPPDEFGGDEVTTWEFEAAELSRLEEIRERLGKGEFAFQKEIGDLFGVSKVAAGKWLEKGQRLGLWTEEQQHHWIAKGKTLRKQGKTEAPMVFTADDVEDF